MVKKSKYEVSYAETKNGRHTQTSVTVEADSEAAAKAKVTRELKVKVVGSRLWPGRS